MLKGYVIPALFYAGLT